MEVQCGLIVWNLQPDIDGTRYQADVPRPGYVVIPLHIGSTSMERVSCISRSLISLAVELNLQDKPRAEVESGLATPTDRTSMVGRRVN